MYGISAVIIHAVPSYACKGVSSSSGAFDCERSEGPGQTNTKKIPIQNVISEFFDRRIIL
jgi:hypothetical protein